MAKKQWYPEDNFSKLLIRILWYLAEFLLKLWIYEIINETYGVKNYMKEHHRSYRCNFCSCEKKAWKKFRLVQDSNPWPLRYWCSTLPIGSGSLNWFVINLWKDDDEVVKENLIWELWGEELYERRSLQLYM